MAGATIRIRVFEQTGHWQLEPGLQVVTDLYVEEDLVFDYLPDQDDCSLLGCPPGLRYRPGFIQIFDLFERFPELREARPNGGFRIELEPVTPGLGYWAMVSVTEPGSNDVGIYVPERN